MSSWYIEEGPESDIVVSSRVRLARNFKDYPFPFRMNKEQGEKIVSSTRNAVNNSQLASEFLFVDMAGLSLIDRQSLVEKHLISPDLADSKKASAAIVSKDEKISIMINEEDHLRIQCLYPGMQIEKAWELCNKIDVMLENNIEFAFSEKLGYLTCCPTNVGTAMRASYMLHLPALVMTGYISGVLEACTKLGVAVRGIYGENTEAAGAMFQVSNQVTLGQNENEILSNISNISTHIIEQERSLRNELYRQNPYRLEDGIFRSLGILSNARIMSSEEVFKHISQVRLGVTMGLVNGISLTVMNQILLLTQAGSLQKALGQPLSPDERDVKRAEMIRSILAQNKV